MKIKKTHEPSVRHHLGRIAMALTAFVALAGVLFYSPSKLLASDHRESPTADANGEGDITDIFAFLDPNNPSQLVLIMNVNPFAVPAETPSYRYSTNFLYQFKIARDEHAVEDLVIQAVFEDVATTTCASGQMIKVYGPARPRVTGTKNIVLRGAPTVTGCTGTTLSEGNMQVFTGLRDDPFVTDVGQLNRILQDKQDLFRNFPGFALGALRGRPVRSDNTSGVDGFGGFNVTSIAIELPKSEVAGPGFLGTKGLIGVWGTTSMTGNNAELFHDFGWEPLYTQFQRVGQQLFKTIFVPSANRDAFNETKPEDDVQNFSSLVPDALTITDNDGTGNTIAGRAGLLTALGFTDASGAQSGRWSRCTAAAARKLQ